MPYTQSIVDELKILGHFNLDSTQEGVKIHSSAEPETIAAAQRLYDRGLTTQPDGGYLTSLGMTAAEHSQKLQQIFIAP